MWVWFRSELSCTERLAVGLSKQQTPASTRYAPPPGPPPNWPQWQTPGGSSSRQTPAPEPSSTGSKGSKKPSPPQESSSQVPVITHSDELKRIAKTCKTAKGNAQVLQETLLYTTNAQEAKENSLVQVCARIVQLRVTYSHGTVI